MTLLQQLAQQSLGRRTSVPPPVAPSGDDWSGVVFSLAGIDLVVPQTGEVQIARSGYVQPLPLCHDWVRGMILHAGAFYTLIDFGKFIGCPESSTTQDANLLLISSNWFNSALWLRSPIAIRRFSVQIPPGAVDSTESTTAAARLPNRDAPAGLAQYLHSPVVDDHFSGWLFSVPRLMHSARFINIGKSPAQGKPRGRKQ